MSVEVEKASVFILGFASLVKEGFRQGRDWLTQLLGHIPVQAQQQGLRQPGFPFSACVRKRRVLQTFQFTNSLPQRSLTMMW